MCWMLCRVVYGQYKPQAPPPPVASDIVKSLPIVPANVTRSSMAHRHSDAEPPEHLLHTGGRPSVDSVASATTVNTVSTVNTLAATVTSAGGAGNTSGHADPDAKEVAGASVHHPPMLVAPELDTLRVFAAIFDGHGGDEASFLAHATMHDVFYSILHGTSMLQRW